MNAFRDGMRRADQRAGLSYQEALRRDEEWAALSPDEELQRAAQGRAARWP
jgi:hypothetical protein